MNGILAQPELASPTELAARVASCSDHDR